jgi:hypothetical protein
MKECNLYDSEFLKYHSLDSFNKKEISIILNFSKIFINKKNGSIEKCRSAIHMDNIDSWISIFKYTDEWYIIEYNYDWRRQGNVCRKTFMCDQLYELEEFLNSVENHIQNINKNYLLF